MNNLRTLFPGSISASDRKWLRDYVDEKTNYLLFKRVFDIFFSIAFLLFVGSWLFPFISLLVWLDSKGPIFFIQKRVGRGGRTFSCIKFRTMVVNREANKKQAEVNDQRITRIGYFLRNYSNDDIPHYHNVLMDDMRLVGPS